MGLELIIIKKITHGEEITKDNEVHRFPCNWYRDHYMYQGNVTMGWHTIKISGENVFTHDQLIFFGKHLINSETKSDNYAKDHLLEFILKKETENLKLKLIATLTTCSDEYYEEHFSKYNDQQVTRFQLIAKVAMSDILSGILSDEELIKLESNKSITYNETDIEMMNRLIKFGLKLIKYGNNGYMGFWSY